MRKVFKIVFWISLLLLVINLFWWGIFTGSGHKIPEKTKLFFRNNSIILIIVCIFSLIIKSRKLYK